MLLKQLTFLQSTILVIIIYTLLVTKSVSTLIFASISLSPPNVLLLRCGEGLMMTHTQASERVCREQNENCDKDGCCAPQQPTVLDKPRGKHNIEIRERVAWGMGRAQEKTEMHTEFLYGNVTRY